MEEERRGAAQVAPEGSLLSGGVRFPAIDLAVFDLDGTLIDSKRDLAESVNATLSHMGLPGIDHRTIESYVGNGAPVLMQRALGQHASDDNIERALSYFLEHYHAHMLDYTALYPGVRESLEQVHEAGIRLAVLTNKPVRNTKGILAGLGIVALFDRAYGGNSFPQRKPHPMGLEALMSEFSTPSVRTLMIGDSAIDIRTARNAQVASAGLTYGFQPETFETDPPDFVYDAMLPLVKDILAAR
ncbi:MAG TPA: HAD-IA family hydrolase [Bryobacteraceae bacterium]|nr:HAD-IA family hydrolase [Bryobacteraceae bacterium]